MNQNNKIIDMSSRAELKIIPVKKKKIDYTGCLGKATLISETGLKKSCAYYDPFGLCNILDCINCENCSYKIDFNNEMVISDYSDINLVHEILFYDRVPDANEIISYLFTEESRYKIIRIADNLTMVDKSQKRNNTLVKKLTHKKGTKQN